MDGGQALFFSQLDKGGADGFAVGSDQVGELLMGEADIYEAFSGGGGAGEFVGEAEEEAGEALLDGEEKDVLHAVHDECALLIDLFGDSDGEIGAFAGELAEGFDGDGEEGGLGHGFGAFSVGFIDEEASAAYDVARFENGDGKAASVGRLEHEADVAFLDDVGEVVAGACGADTVAAFVLDEVALASQLVEGGFVQVTEEVEVADVPEAMGLDGHRLSLGLGVGGEFGGFLFRPVSFAHGFEDGDGDGGKDDDEDDDLKVLFDPGDSAEEVSGEDEAPDPDRASGDAEGEELSVRHLAHARDEGSESADDGDPAGEDEGLAAVSVEELFGLFQVGLFEDAGVFFAKEACSQLAADPVVDVVAEDGGEVEGKAEEEEIESARLCREDSGGEDEGVAGEEREDDEASLGEDDRAEDAVDPASVVSNEFGDLVANVKDIVEQFGGLRGSIYYIRLGGAQ